MHIEIPSRFPADWHHQLGTRLAPFPRCFTFHRLRIDSPDVGPLPLTFWPDLASFVEDQRTAQLLYLRTIPSDLSICVAFHKASQEWQVRLYHDCELMSATCASDYEQVMSAALTHGFCAADTASMLAAAGND